jgi:hypothetical protein
MSTVTTQTPWAVLLCKFNDNANEPFPRRFYENLFTNTGVGLNNMVDFFRLYSHGSIDLGGSRVFGWLTLPESLAQANQHDRGHVLPLARQTATNHGLDLSPFWGTIVCVNVGYETFGFLNGRAAVADSAGTYAAVLGQEMGHGYGLDHSRIDGSTADYQDPWDVMSAKNTFQTGDPRIGPGLNAANMDGRGWLDPERVWSRAGFFENRTLQLRPHHRRDLDGFLVARVGPFYVEYRHNEGWDAGIPRSAVLAHRLKANLSYLMRGTAGNADLQPGDVVQRSDGQEAVRVEVTGIDATNRVASVRLSLRPTKPTAIARISPFPASQTVAPHTVTARDIASSQALTEGTVVVRGPSGTVVLTTGLGTAFSFGFRPKRTIRIGPDGEREVEVRYPSVNVRLPDPYEDVNVDLGFPDL